MEPSNIEVYYTLPSKQKHSQANCGEFLKPEYKRQSDDELETSVRKQTKLPEKEIIYLNEHLTRENNELTAHARI